MKPAADDILNNLQKLSNREIAEHSARFFKSGPGEYAEGDRFLGIRVPNQRKIARKYRHLPLVEVRTLLESEFHEVRLTGLLILVYQYKKSDADQQDKIYQFYINHLQYVNNWDLVDSSAKYIAGHYLFDKDRSILYDLAASDILWERRVAVLTTFYFIDQGDFTTTLELAEKLVNDDEDLIHKAVGWMLREIGKKEEQVLIQFLDKHCTEMPRTMLRYAIEKFPQKVRSGYLNKD